MNFESNIGMISRVLIPDESILWSVPDFTKILKSNVLITSPWFSYHEDVWCLALIVSTVKMHTSGEHWKNQDNIVRVGCESVGFFLWQKQPGKIQYDNITLAMVGCGRNNEVSGRLNSFGTFGRDNFLTRYCFDFLQVGVSTPGGRINFTCKIQKQEEITEQILSVQETIETGIYEENTNEKKHDEKPELKGTNRLIENLKTLYLDACHSNFVLRVDGREFRVHKGILGARSPVFAAMFEHDMAETKKDNVDIPDCAASAFEIFLLYIYTGSAENLSQDNIFDVYYAADKYRVDDLKADCMEFMKSTLSVNTFCDVISLSVRHNEKELLEEATRFFTENIKKIIKTVHWEKFLTENPSQANKLLIKALN